MFFLVSRSFAVAGEIRVRGSGRVVKLDFGVGVSPEAQEGLELEWGQGGV